MINGRAESAWIYFLHLNVPWSYVAKFLQLSSPSPVSGYRAFFCSLHGFDLQNVKSEYQAEHIYIFPWCVNKNGILWEQKIT